MNDAKIREELHLKHLRCYHNNSQALVIDELGLNHGKVRADVVVVADTLIGYEIKSDADSLKRLSDQVDAYSLVFDECIIVVSGKHLDFVASTIPTWWGIFLAVESENGQCEIQQYREATTNHQAQNAYTVRLLWANEVRAELSQIGVSPSNLHGPRKDLYDQLLELVKEDRLRSIIRQRLRSRQNWKRRGQLSRYGDSFPPTATLSDSLSLQTRVHSPRCTYRQLKILLQENGWS